MDDFFNRIKAAINKIPEVDSDDKKWEAFNRYRSIKTDDESQPISKKTWPWLPISIGGLIGLLLFSNIFWGYKVINQHSNNMTTVVHDTVYITKNIDSKPLSSNADLNNNIERNINNKNDYSSLEKKYNELIKKYETSLNLVAQMQLKTEQNYIRNDKLNLADLYQNDNINKNKSDNIASEFKNIKDPISFHDNNFNDYNTIEKVAIINKLQIKFLSIEPNSINLNTYSPIRLDNKNNNSFLEIIRPKSLSIFSQIGLHFENGDGIGYTMGNHYGVGLTTLFSNHIRGKLIVSYSKSISELEDIMSIPSEFPQVVVPEGALIDELELTSTYYDASIGFDYLFKTIFLFRPYVGLNYNNSRQQYTNLDYKFIFENARLEILGEDSSVITNHHLGLNLGSDINLTHNFDAFINFTYTHKLSGNINSVIRLNTGLQYHF
ncbi:hypothetical protein N9176_00215 [bacterium]|nr:hypothetical protein [bacterium]